MNIWRNSQIKETSKSAAFEIWSKFGEDISQDIIVNLQYISNIYWYSNIIIIKTIIGAFDKESVAFIDMLERIKFG